MSVKNMSKQKQNETYSVSQFTRFTRVMALFTASLFLVSSNLALPAQAAALDQAMRGEMTRQEWRQFRQENRAAGIPGRGLPNPVFTTQPIQVPQVDTSATINAMPLPGGGVNTGGNINIVGGNGFATTTTSGQINASAGNIVQIQASTNPIGDLKGATKGSIRQANREARREDRQQAREDRRADRGPRESRMVTQPVSVQRIRETKEDRTARIQEHKNDKLSRFVVQENAGALIKLDNGANLDLTASTRNITIGDRLIADGAFVTIEVGGEKKNIYAGSSVSAAEYVAVKQVLTGGKQELVVNGSGIATGGTVDLSQVSATRNTMKADGLTVASGVTAVGNLTKNSSFRLTGDLVNNGSIYAVASEKGRFSGEISAVNITNNEGALISSDAGNKHGNRADAIDLSLNAEQNFTNLGEIKSSGDLNITAGGAIKNSGNTTAKDNLSLNSSDITNTGVASATKGNITVDSPVGTVMNVNNDGGKLQALKGDINVRAPGNVDGLDANVIGGDLLSKNLNINAGQGLTTVDVNDLTGVVKAEGWGTHVTASTANLKLGEICMTGDPTFYNDAVNGDITITGNITSSEALSIIASRDIIIDNTVTSITAQDGGGVGQQINLVAGAQIDASGATGGTSTTLPPGTPITLGSVLVTGPSGTGGSITGGAPTLLIGSSGTGSNAGGEINLIAFAVGGVAGDITLATGSTINSSAGDTSAAAGSINVSAGGDIQLGSVLATGSAASGNVLVRNTNADAGAGVTYAVNGTATGSYDILVNPVTAGSTAIGAVTTSGTETIDAGTGGLTINGTHSADGAIAISSAAGLTSTGALSITSTGSTVDVNANSIATSGALNITGDGAVDVDAGAGAITTTTGALTIQSTTSTTTVFAGSIDTANGDLDIIGAGAVAVTTDGAAGINSGTGAITITSNTSNTTVTMGVGSMTTTSATGDILIGGGANAVNTTVTGAAITTTGGDVSILGETGTVAVTLTGALSTGNGLINIDSNGLAATLSAASVTTTNGSVTVSGNNGTSGIASTGAISTGGGALTVNSANVAADAYITAGSISTAGGAVDVDSQNDVTINLGAGTLTTASGNVTVDAGGDVSLTASSVDAGSGSFNVNTSTGNGGFSTTATAFTSGSFTVNLGTGNFTKTGVGNVSITTDAYSTTVGTFSVGSNALTITTRTAGTTIGLNGGAGVLNIDATELGDIIATALNIGTSGVGGSGTITNAGSQDLSGTPGTTAGAYDLVLTSNADILGGGNYTLGGQNFTATANGAVTLGNITGGTGTAQIDISANSGNLTLGDLTNADGTIDVDASGTVNVGTITTVAGVVDVDAGGTATVAAITKTGAGAITVDGTSVTVTGATSSNAGGSVTYTNTSGLIQTGSITTTGGLIDLGNGTGTTITTGALQTAGGNINIDAGTALLIDSIAATAGGTVTLDAGTSVTVTNNITGSATSLVVNNTNGLIQAGNITTNGLVDLGGAGTTSISVGAVDSGAGLVDLDTTGTVQATSITTTGAVDIDAGQAVTVSGATSGNTGVAIDSVNSSINVGAVTTVGGTIDLNTAPGGTTITTGALQTNGGNIDIDAGTAVQIASINALNGGAYTIDAGTNVTLVGAVTGNAASLTIGNTAGSINTAGITTNGDIDLGNAGTTSITVAGALSANAGAITLDGSAAIGVTGAITTTGSVAANGASISYLTIGGPTSSVLLNATGGQVNGGTITSVGGINLDATTSITTGNLAGLSVDADAASISVGTVTTTAGGSVVLTATGGSVVASTIDAADGSVDVDATTTVNLGDVTTTGAVTIDGNTGVTTLNIGGPASSVVINSTSGAISTGTINSAGLIDVGGATTTSVQTSNLTAGAAGIDIDTAGQANIAAATTTGALNILAGTNIVVPGAINADLGATLTGTAGFINVTGNITTTSGGITANAGGSTVTIANLQTSGGSVDVDAVTSVQLGTVTAGAGNINVDAGTTSNLGVLANTGTIAVNSGTNATIAGINNAAGSPVYPGPFQVSVVSGNSTTLTGDIDGGTGNILIQGTTGDVTLQNANLTTGTLVIVAGNNTSASNLQTTAGGVDIQSGNNTTVTTITTTTGNIDIDSGNDTTITTVTTTGGMLNVNSGGQTTIGTINIGDDVIIVSDNDINIGTTTTLGDIFLYSGANINVLGTLTADPIVMTAAINVNLGGSLVADDGITVVAGQNIQNTVGGITINGNGVTDGGNITMVAGADFTEVPATSVTINGASVTGGSILLTAVAGFGNITANGANGTGGDITLSAFSNGFSGGQVLLPVTSGIVSTGSAANASGDVFVVAGAVSGQAVQIGSITQSTATNGAAGASTIIQSATPQSGQVIANDASYSGQFEGGALTAADIRIGNMTNRGGAVQVNSLANVGLGIVNVSGTATTNAGSINISASGSDVFDIGVLAGSNFAQGLLANGGTTGPGGTINVTNLGSTGIRTVAGLSITTTAGAGGSLSLNADQGTISLASGTYSVNGAGAGNAAGDISLTAAGYLVTGGGAATLQSLAGVGGAGGTVSIIGTGSSDLTLGTGAGQLSISMSGTGSDLDVSVGGNLTVANTSNLTADVVQLSTTLAGSDLTINGTINSADQVTLNSADAIAVNNAVTATNQITATANGSINGSGSLVGTNVALYSAGGNIGNSSASRLNVNATNLVANAQAGSAFINDSAGGVAISANSGAANTFDLQANGAVSNNAGATVTANDVVLRSTGSTVTLNDLVTGTATATIRGNGAITTAGAGQVNGGTVNLTSDAASVGTSAASRFQVDANNLVVNATAGDAYLNDVNNVNIGPGSSVVVAAYDLTASGDISSSGTITAQDVSLRTFGSFFLNSTIVGNTSISLRSNNSITNANLGGATLTTPRLNLNVDNGSIGSSSVSRLNIDANNLNAVATNGSVWITDANDVTIVGATNASNGNFDIAAANNLSTAAGSTITSTTGSVLLRATAGSINTAGAITANTAGQSVTLRAGQSLLNGQVGGTFTTPTLNLISDNGNIGASTASRFDIGLGVANVTANAAAGSVFLTTASTVNLGAGTSSALNTFDVLTTGAADLTTSGAISATTVNLTAANNLTTNAAVTATGDATLTAANDIATNAAVSGNNVAYIATAGGVTLGGATTGTTSISITSNDSIVNASISGGLTAPQITLVTNNDVGVNAATRLDLNATNLTVNATGGVFINDTAGGVNFSGANTSGGAFDVTANGDISNSGTLNTGSLTLAATGAGSDILINNQVAANGLLSFTANGAGGQIAISANVTATAAIAMSADGDLTTGIGASVSNGGSINLNSNNGDIGTSALSPFVVDANLLQATAPNGNVWIADANAVTIANITGLSLAGQTFDVYANGNLTVDGATSISANDVVLRAGGATGVLTLNGAVSGTTSATLRAAGDIAPGSLGGPANVTAAQVNLISDNGNIGTNAGSRLIIDATNLTANAAGSVFVEDNSGGVNIGAGSSSAGGTFDVVASVGNLTTSGSITAANVILTSDVGSATIGGVITSTGLLQIAADQAVTVNAAVNGGVVQLISDNAGVQLNAQATGTTSVLVNSADDITNATIVGGLSAPLITLISGDNIGSVGDRLNVDAVNLSVTAANDVFVTDSNSVNITSGVAGGIFDVLATNNLTSTGSITGNNVVLRAQTGSLGLGANVNGTTSVTLRSFNGMTNLNFTTITTGAGGTINLISDNGDIGTSPTSRLTLDADNLTANAANGSVYILDTDSVNLGAGSSSAANNFDLVAAQNITNDGIVSANNVSLRATAGTLTLGALINGTTSVSLRSGGDITDAAVVNVVSDQINLTSDNGNIGTSVNPLNIDALNLTANAFNGNVFVNDANNITIGGGTSNALNTFSVTAGSNLSTTGTITAADVVLTASTGSLFINALITGGNSISLTQALTMTNANIVAALVSPQINLTSTGGSIGTGTFNRLVLDAASISFNAAGSVFYQDPNTVNVSGATASGTIDILANNDLSTSGLVAGNNIVFTSTLGDVNLNGPTTSTTNVTVTAGDDINVNAPIAGTVLAFDATGDINFNASVLGTTSLTAVAGDNIDVNATIGAPVVSLTANTGNVTIDAASGATNSFTVNAGNNIDINAAVAANDIALTTTSGDVNINALTSAVNTVSVDAGDDINTTAAVNGAIVSFDATNNINLNGNVLGLTSVSLNAGDTITQGVANSVAGGALSVTFVNGPVTLNTAVTSLTSNAAGQTLTINENNEITLLGQNLGTLNVTAGIVSAGNIFVQNALNLDALSLVDLNGDVVLNASTTTTGNTSFDASGTITQNAGVVTADQLNLLWGTGNVTLATEVNSLSANGGTNSLTINEATSIDIVNLLVGAATINAGGNISTSASFPNAISALTGNLALNATGDIILGSDVSAVATAILNAGGTITQNTGTVSANTLDLTWVTGAVELDTAANNLNANAAGQDLTINNAGGINILNINLNALTVNAGLTTAGDLIVVNPLTVPGPLVLNNAAGDIILNAGITSLSAELTASGTLTQTAGVIETGSLILTWGTGAVTLDTSVDYLVATSAGNSLTIDQTGDIVLGGIVLNSLTVTAASDIETSVDFTVTNLNLTATGGSINLNSNVNVTNVANLVADNTITQGAANVFGGEGTLNLTWQTGDVTLTTAIDTVTAAGSVGGALTINEQTGITIGTITNIADLTVSAGQVTAGDIDVAQALNLDTLTLSTDGNIGMNVNISAGTSASFLASGDILQTGGTITTPDLTVGYIGLAGGTVTISDTTNNGADQSITVVGLKDASITSNETGIVTLQASTGNSLVIDAADSSQFVFGGDSAAATNLTVTADNVLNENTQTATTITIQSLTGDLTVDGGAGGNWVAFAGGTNFSAFQNLNLDGIQDITGNATFSSGVGFAINVLATADVEATGSITLNTCNLNLAGILIGNPIYFNCPLGAGTIANSNGDVLLTSDLIFTGLDLAIIASGSIIENGITVIDLSNAGGDGGSLTLLAGFDFTPATLGQVGPDSVLYTITGNSGTGGSIQLGTTNITTASTGILGDGGNVFAAASGGSVELNNVDTSAALGAGGNVTVTGENGITVNGNINSSAIGSGNVSLAVGTSVVNGQVLIGNGEMFGTGSIDFGTATAGSILVSGDLNAGDATATLLGALTAVDTINVNGTLTADTLNVNAGDGNTTVVSSNVLNLNSTSNGAVAIQNNTGDLAIGTVTGANQNLFVVNNGTIDVNSAMSIGALTLIQNSIGAEGISISAAVTTSSGISLTNAGTNSITVGGALNAGGNITIAQNGVGGADVLINASLTTTGGNIDIDSADVISTLAGTSINSAGTLDLFAVGSILIGGAGAVSSGSNMSIVSLAGDVVFGTNNVTSGGTTDISGGNVTTGGDVISTGVMNITATTGEVVLNDALSGLSDINVLAVTNVVFNPGINAIGTLGNVSVEATNGSISLNGVDTQIDGFDVILTAGTDISATGAQSLSLNALNNLTINAPIDLTGGLVLTGESVTANGNISADAGISIGVKSSPFTTNGDITSLGDIFITTNVLENTNSITGANVYIQSFAGNGVTVDGSAGPGGLITATGVIEVTGTGGDATFLGEQTFDAPDTAFTSATNFAVVIGLGADVTVTGTLDLNTCNLVLLGSLTAPIINFNCPLGAGTIANSIGNVDLTGVGALNFSGLDLAILAQGNVLAGTNTSINLSSSTGDGGDLLVVAGFDFTPATGGQVNFSPTLFTITGTSTSGGNIDFTGLTINTGSTFAGGNGGSVTLVANGGLTNAGTITTEAITTTGDNNGGAVTIIGESDIHLNGTVNTTGTNGTGGDVTLAVAQAFLAPGPSTQVGNGELLQGGFAVGAASLGELLAGTINAGNGNVAITSSSGGFDTTSIADLTANSVSFTVGDGSAIVDTSAISNLNVTSYGSGSGYVELTDNHASITLTSNAGSNDVSVSITNNANIAVGAGAHTYGLLDLNGSLVTVNGDIDASSNVTANGAAGVAVNGSIISDATVSLAATIMGNVVISGPVTGASVNLATNSSFGNIFIDGVVTANAIGGAITITTNGGGVSQTANVDADILNLNLTNGGTVNLSNALNSVDALNVNAAGAASVTFVDSVALTLTATSNAAQDLNVSTTGTLDLASAIVANDVVLSGATLDVDNTVNATNATLTATAGDLTITSSVTATGNATLTSDAGDVIVNAAVSGDVTDISTGIGSGGLIFLSADVTGTTSVDLVSDGGLTQVAGTIFGGDLGVAFNTGAATLTTDVASLDSIVNGTSLTVNEANAITLGANLGTDLTVNTTNGSIDTTVPLSFANLNLNAGGLGSDLNLGADVTGSTTIVLTANDAIVPAIGTVINGGALTLNFGNLGPTVLGTNVASLTTNNAGGDLTIINTGDIVLNGQDVASLSVTALNGDITTAAALTGLNTLSLTAGGSNDINLNGGAVSATTLNLTAAGGNVTQNATSSITATTLNLDVDATADLDQVANNVSTLNASGAGNVFLDNGANALTIGTVGAAQSLTITNGAGGITIGADLTTTGDLQLTTNTLTNSGFAVNANMITVSSEAGQGLTVNGGAGVNVAQYGATNGVFFNATLDNLVLNGNTTFTSIAELSALNGTDMIVISTGANVIGQQQLTVNTCNLILQGILVGNPLVWNNPCGNGTIANSTGDVNLLGDIIYNGQDLAILASGSINAAGATVINLTNSSGNGGNLTLMAGYDFTPATPGQVTNGNVEYTISGYSASGGNINLGGLNVITNGSAGSSGGNVVAVANGGGSAAGNITIGDITSNGDNGGNLQVIAEGAIDLGAVNLNGTIAGGNATISTATPSNGAGITVFNGIVTGTFTAGANLGGSVTFDSIDTNNGGDVTLVANLNTGTAGTVTGDVVTLTSSSDIGVDAANRFTVNANTVTGTAVGDAFIRNTNTAASTLGAITVATGGTIDAYFTGDLATGAQTAGVIELRTDGAFNVTGVLNGSTSIGLTSGTDLTNTQVAAANLVTPLLTLRTSNNADIGSTGTAFQVGAGVGEIRIDTATNGGDSAFVTSLATGGVNLGASTATNDLFFSANGPLTVIGNVTNVDGNINITGGSGTLRINDGVTVQANSPGSNGNVFIGNAINGGSKQSTFITFGDGAQIIGNAAVKPGGNVTIQMGELTTRVRTLTNPPRNVTYNAINGGVIQGGKSAKPFYAGRNGDPANTITADNATVFISNTLKNKNIILEGNVLIQADPPSVAGEAATTNAYLPNGGSFETVANKANDGLTTNTASSTEATFANTMLNTMFNSNAGVMANTAIGTDLNATATAAGVGNGAGSTVTAADTTLVGGVATTGEDNSYMVGGYGPTAQADASICSDVELGVSGNEVAKTAHSNRVVLKKGNVLFVPFQDTVVETPHGNVTIEAKSVALVSISNDKLAVYDIEDSHKGSVSVNAHGQTITLAPGNHVTVAHATAGEFAQVNAIEAIPHRNVATKTIKAGVKAHTSEFSVASAISSIKPLQLVMCSKHPQAKQVANKMMKTTAILLHMGGKGEFQHYFKPAMTAMAK